MRDKFVQEMDYAIRKYLKIEVMRADISYNGSDWYDSTYNVSERGYYSIQYYVISIDPDNVVLLNFGRESTVAYVYYRFHIV